jgi:hypothetical protein
MKSRHLEASACLPPGWGVPRAHPFCFSQGQGESEKKIKKIQVMRNKKLREKKTKKNTLKEGAKNIT